MKAGWELKTLASLCQVFTDGNWIETMSAYNVLQYGKDKGWVYFKGDEEDNETRIKRGWNPVSRYITIETGVRPKPQCEYSKNDPHKYIHTLLLCYESSWHQLKFVKKRETKNCQHYSQYDDVH